MNKKPTLRRKPRQATIVLRGSTREGIAATYPRGKVYDPWGIAPCCIGCAQKTGSGNEIRIILEYGQPIKF